MSDHCQNCTVRGDLEACRTVCERATSNPCDVPTSWGAAARIASLEAALLERDTQCHKFAAQVIELEAENARLLAVVEWYAEYGGTTAIEHDYGKRARAALAKKGGE